MNIETMDDKTLIELSGKSVGIVGEWVENYLGDEYFYSGNNEGVYYEHRTGGHYVWNPLESNDDAFSLAVEHRLSIKQGAWEITVYEYFSGSGEYFSEKHGDNPEAATRRAIVRAAAKLQLRSEGKK